MKNKRFSMATIALLIGVILSSCGVEEINQERDQEIVNQIKKMSLEEKIGQMMIVGVEGYALNSSTKKMIVDKKVGGFVILGNNVRTSKQLFDLVNSLKSTNKQENRIPLFLSIDEEGGRITRFPEELRKLPSNKEIGELDNQEVAYQIGRLQAEKLKLFGLNMNFAPVLDVNSNPKNPIIGDRSYGNNPEVVSRLGVQTMKGIQENGIIPVLKHFPGHGDTIVDSHQGLPSVSHDINRLENLELVPFQEAIDEQAEVVMTAHILLPKLDATHPATMSKKIITDLLREELHFDGIVITDDMTMKAISANYGISEAAVATVQAGSDMIMVAHNHQKGIEAYEALLNAVKKGELSEERIDKSVYRILNVKKKYQLSDERSPFGPIRDINEKIGTLLMEHF
ncbi:beta-N-acetylhexosaminidase [Fredinandcohnia sp. 179-A 10B2 NHS]|uniref:beta-N-acetylhexosaminidase n=1 Tax=Fredinandcohnia sp. 179-A 10B2 NHS TaxID=3235176 RepID=UPI0039A38EB0